jgi:FkbM family methyltransferase
MTHTFTLEALTTPIQMHSHRKVFNILCCPEMWHPSWWSFLDELGTREAWWNIRPGDVVLDVGADFGSYTLSALAMGASLVYAWSPPFKLPLEPIECATMARSYDANQFEGQLLALSSGLYDRAGWLAAFDGPRSAQFHETRDAALAAIEGAEGHCAVFPVDTLDSCDVPNVDWLKIDTEGCELAILRGGIETIKRFRPVIILENHTHLDPDCEEKCTTFLAALDYEKLGTRPHHSISHSLFVPRGGR